jgi:hypothetical protein
MDAGEKFYYSLSWVPGKDMVSYLEKDTWEANYISEGP